MTGYARKSAIRLLNHPLQGTGIIQRSRLPLYGPEVQQALFLAWKAADYICAKRLVPFLPSLVASLEHHGHLQISEEQRRHLLAMSSATAERFLRTQRKPAPYGLSTTQAGTLLYRSPESVLAALQRARTLLPFPMRGLDTDNGTEFINEVVFAYCEREQITFTRGRPERKNDQCRIEQKNGAIVRQFVGYDRLI